MKAIVADGTGGPEVLSLSDLPDPGQPGPGEVLLDVVATAVNRADVAQRQGNYAPPPGASAIIGLECSGTVAALGNGVPGLAVGQEVTALLAGGGYAEQVLVPAGQVMPVPGGLDLITASAFPEVACTVWSNLVDTARLRSGEWVLLHGGSSGIGTFAIQLARARGAHVAVTAGSAAKLERCRDLGAELLVNYREQDFVAEVKEGTGGRGVDVILDVMGAAYLQRNLAALAPDGRLAIIGLMGGRTAEIDLGTMLGRRLAVHATSLRSRPLDQKARICADVAEHVWPLVADSRIVPVIDRVLPLADAAQAHRLMEESGHIGKIVLQVR